MILPTSLSFSKIAFAILYLKKKVATSKQEDNIFNRLLKTHLFLFTYLAVLGLSCGMWELF